MIEKWVMTCLQGDPDSHAGAACKKLFRAFYAHADKAEKRHLADPR